MNDSVPLWQQQAEQSVRLFSCPSRHSSLVLGLLPYSLLSLKLKIVPEESAWPALHFFPYCDYCTSLSLIQIEPLQASDFSLPSSSSALFKGIISCSIWSKMLLDSSFPPHPPADLTRRVPLVRNAAIVSTSFPFALNSPPLK